MHSLQKSMFHLFTKYFPLGFHEVKTFTIMDEFKQKTALTVFFLSEQSKTISKT